MILLYHKIDTENKTEWWVTADRFYRHLVQLSNKKVVYLDDYDPKNPDHVVITFDGVYKNILKYAAPLLKKFNYPFELFVTGDFIGKNNSFDTVEPNAKFATAQELKRLLDYGGRLQWHTKTHRTMTNLTDEEIKNEIMTPASIKELDKAGFKWFAYPHGVPDDRSKKFVQQQYRGGLACDEGSIKDKTIWPRKIVTEATELSDEKVSVIISSYNYGHFLVEAIESTLRQTYLPDEILLSDDASTDNSLDIMQVYAKQHPELIRVNHNDENMGIEAHFNKAVKMTSGTIIGILGADNRYQSNYIETCFKVLTKSSQTGIAYTDLALFGNRAEYMHKKFYEEYQGDKLDLGIFIINFPAFTKANKEVLLKHRNFMHGSSMYKRLAFNQAGGYKSRTGTSSTSSEDYTLFQSMIRKNWNAQKAEGIFLEYRQHSAEQANQQFTYFSELAFLRDQFKRSKEEIELIRQDKDKYAGLYQDALKNIESMKNSKFWKMKVIYGKSKTAIRHPKRSSLKIINHIKRRTSDIE